MSWILNIVCNYVLYISCVALLIGYIIISIQTRFVQIRLLPSLFKMTKGMFSSKEKGVLEGKHTILPHKALFTAMSTTLGIATIVCPVIAINLGGPGALLGFLLVSFLGSASTYVEVLLSVQLRHKLPSGEIMGGPMQYLKHILSPSVARWYGFCCFILMAVWSSAQANQLSAALNSPLLEKYQISPYISGAFISLLIVSLVLGGIKKIGSLEAKLIPIKFLFYVGACLFILLSDIPRLLDVLKLIWTSAFSPYSMATGAVVGGLMQTLRWGVFKGTQTCEAGLGTQTIPHAMAETNDPVKQATLAMLSTYASGIIAFISGCVSLMTNTWQDPSLPLGMSMVTASFQMYFASFGIVLITSCALVFSFGTILGNSYNGSQAFTSFTGNRKKLYLYYAFTAGMIFWGSVSETKTVWALSDIVLACMALPHMLGLVLHVTRKPKETAVAA